MAIQLPTKPTPPKDDLAEYIIFLYGSPKIGKTTFASKFEKPLFLATEPGLNALTAYEVPILNWMDFLDACNLLATQKHDFKTIVIDTVDNLCKFCSDYVCRKNNIAHESDLGYGKGWKLVADEFQRAITKLAAFDFGLVFISHEKSETEKTPTQEIIKKMPTITSGFRKYLLGLSDLILYAHMTTAEKGEQKRVLRTKPSDIWEAGDRTNRLPETMEFDYDIFMKAWEGKQ